jgi:hypothetical protein
MHWLWIWIAEKRKSQPMHHPHRRSMGNGVWKCEPQMCRIITEEVFGERLIMRSESLDPKCFIPTTG